MKEGFASPEKKLVTMRGYEMYLDHFKLSEDDLAHKNVLDVGAGLSDFSKEVATRFAHTGTMVVALDPTYAFIHQDYDAYKKSVENANMELEPVGVKVNPVSPDFRAKQRFEQVRSHTTNVAGSHQELPFTPKSFDLVLAHNSILQYKDRTITRRALHNISIALKEHGELRMLPANLIQDKGGTLYTYAFEAPTPETQQEAESLGLEIGPDQEAFSVYRELEEVGHTFYAVLSAHDKRLRGRFMAMNMPDVYVLIMRHDSEVPHVVGARVIYRLSFKDSTDGFHIPSELIRIKSSEREGE